LALTLVMPSCCKKSSANLFAVKEKRKKLTVINAAIIVAMRKRLVKEK